MSIIAAVLPLLLFLSAQSAAAQIVLQKRVVASGGATMGSPGFSVSGTAGQAGTGSLGGTNFAAHTGYWRVPQIFATGVADLTGIPQVFTLEQNYPNPFNPLTTITFALPRESAVRLRVFDVSGRLVEELVNERRDAGIYHETFAAPNLASGIYFYHMEAEGFVWTRKSVLLK